MSLSRSDRLRIMAETRDRMEARERLTDTLEPGFYNLGRRVLEAEGARDRVRALLVSRAREIGRFDHRAVLTPAECAHAIARDDDERDALIDALLAAAQAAEDDWLAIGGALVRHRSKRREVFRVPRP
ncbi:MAG: hypothetical protein KF723_03315 [Rhizobiaceae bacterium]|nr:hypothetical protein [Rhizobiaceae bacterium]